VQRAPVTRPVVPASQRIAPPAPPPPPPPATTGRLAVGQHDRSVEIEIHGLFALTQWAWAWSGSAVGPGIRIGIPLTANGFLTNVNNDVRINFGVEGFIWPEPLFYWWVSAPVVLQWNVFLTGTWSIFFEAGGAFDVFPTDGANCYDHSQSPWYYCDRWAVHPAGGFGARIHFAGGGRFPTLTMRLGYPMGFTLGISL
jgi:hypothetical protein